MAESRTQQQGCEGAARLSSRPITLRGPTVPLAQPAERHEPSSSGRNFAKCFNRLLN
jgi:hypothetical protein